MFSSSQTSGRHNPSTTILHDPLQSTFSSSGLGNSFTASSPSRRFVPTASLSSPSTQLAATRPALPLPSPAPLSRPATLSERQRAATVIAQTLTADEQYPDFDSYLPHGLSFKCEALQGPRAPFQKVRMYNIPDAVFMQYNRGMVSTSMGLFAELDHAWVVIDNALFIWNYTDPKPDLIAFEGQPSNINVVALARPRPGVFLSSVTHLLVIAMTSEISLVGVSCTNSGGHKSLELFATGMQASTKGINASVVAASSSGRIFFAGANDVDVYELKYQQTEGWFQGKCSKVNHSGKGFGEFLPSFAFNSKKTERVLQMVVDDSRNLLYTLSSHSTIRVFHMKDDGSLNLIITKLAPDIIANITHIITINNAFNTSTKMVSINPIPASEASRYHLVATMASGHRIYFSATSSFPWATGADGAPTVPTTMQAVHVKYPTDGVTSTGEVLDSATKSKTVAISSNSRLTKLYTPGYYLTVRNVDQSTDSLILTVSHPTRVLHSLATSATIIPAEVATQINLQSKVEDIGFCSSNYNKPYPAHGNELAVQYDEPSAEIAILTNSGVHIIRRRRLVDVFTALIRSTGGGEAFDVAVTQLSHSYTRDEILATALAVACGQGLEMVTEGRMSKISDPEILEVARRIFIEHGGRPTFSPDAGVDSKLAPIDIVQPSPRHTGIARYMSRLLRSIWKTPLVKKSHTPAAGTTYNPTVSSAKLQSIQKDLVSLQNFFKANKSFIEGLSGSEALSRAASREDEILLQAEHRALHALTSLLADTIEGLSFVLLLFEEQLHEIVALLPDNSKTEFPKMTYEQLFSTSTGHDVAKDLIKAIVNRNITKGSNVETIAEGLRRRCGSFCSAEDVVIFKAQELLKRAAEAGGDSEQGRNMLNDSLDLFKSVAGCLPMDYLKSAVSQYLTLNFFAGAIHLCLEVAAASDPTNRALSWIRDGSPAGDPREPAYDTRKQCYRQVYKTIVTLDKLSVNDPGMVDGVWTILARRKSEAYHLISSCQDEVFLTCLYDWYLQRNMSDRLLEIKTPFVVTYLKRKANDDIAHADLLWKYHIQQQQFREAASVQLDLARSPLKLSLGKRIEYLGQAAANASVYSSGTSRAVRQRLVQEISTLIDVANVQYDLLQRLEGDPRINPSRKASVLAEVGDQIMDLSTLFNMYSNPGGYHDICLQIMYLANHRNVSDIKAAWESLIEHVHNEASKSKSKRRPYELVIDTIRALAGKLQLSTIIFPVPVLLPLLERYVIEHQLGVARPNWVVDLFLDLKIPHETLYTVLESIFYNDEVPFHGKNRRYIGRDLLYVIVSWYKATMLDGVIFGREVVANRVLEMLVLLQQCGLDEESVQTCGDLRSNIERALQ